MAGAPYHPREAKRLDALHELEILDTETSAAWQRIVELASIICETPIALVSLIDEERQWFKARVGLEPAQTPREQAFCGYAILQDGLFVVDDPQNDDRFADNPLVTGNPNIRFYAGMPISVDDDLPLGTVCVIDTKPRTLNETQIRAMKILADEAESLMRLRRIAIGLQRGVDLNKATRDVINAVAHEVMNPLTPAMLQVATMKKGASEDTERQLARIERNLQRIRDVIRNSAAELSRET